MHHRENSNLTFLKIFRTWSVFRTYLMHHGRNKYWWDKRTADCYESIVIWYVVWTQMPLISIFDLFSVPILSECNVSPGNLFEISLTIDKTIRRYMGRLYCNDCFYINNSASCMFLICLEEYSCCLVQYLLWNNDSTCGAGEGGQRNLLASTPKKELHFGK